MATIRKVVFANDYFYHVFNRGVERRTVFTDKRVYTRALDTLDYYRFGHAPLRFSKFLIQPRDRQFDILTHLNQPHNLLVDIISFCLMPNHFHFLVKQRKEAGISTFISNFTNSYTKYLNTKLNRNGPLFTGVFKAVLIETDEQMVHVSRYIHLNPVTSLVIREKDLDAYPWSSLGEYLGMKDRHITNTEPVMSQFKTKTDYHQFVHDQIGYARELEKIRHLALEE